MSSEAWVMVGGFVLVTIGIFGFAELWYHVGYRDGRRGLKKNIWR